MGIRQIRYCDISGTEHHVDTHHINIDQMHVEIDLAAGEYRKLLELLRPYLDAGRIEASIPDLPATTRTPRQPTSPHDKRNALTPQQRAHLRQWAEEKGLPIPVNNQFKRSVIDQWRAETANTGQNTPPHTEPPPAISTETPAVETTATPAPTTTAAETEPAGTTPAGTTAEQPAPTRRDLIRQALLTEPHTWMTVAEITDLIEQRTSDTTERNATSELLRRMANHGQAQRDDTTRPVRYKAPPDTHPTSRTDNT